jgi:hypothetical protein
MILDSQNLLSNQQAITATANSANVFDLSVARDLGPGSPLMFAIILTQTFLAAGAATLTAALVAADDAALTTNPVVLMQTDAIGKANLLAGVQLLRTQVPAMRLTALGAKRYIGLIYTVATGPFTAGKATAGFFMPPYQANIAYASGLNLGGF